MNVSRLRQIERTSVVGTTELDARAPAADISARLRGWSSGDGIAGSLH